jgi:CDGSH-type Zn-finger protein
MTQMDRPRKVRVPGSGTCVMSKACCAWSRIRNAWAEKGRGVADSWSERCPVDSSFAPGTPHLVSFRGRQTVFSSAAALAANLFRCRSSNQKPCCDRTHKIAAWTHKLAEGTSEEQQLLGGGRGRRMDSGMHIVAEGKNLTSVSRAGGIIPWRHPLDHRRARPRCSTTWAKGGGVVSGNHRHRAVG